MSKGGFSLQSAQFSDSDSQTPVQTLMSSYNRNKIVSKISTHLSLIQSQCKENIKKYIQLNQFGAKFNMYALLAQMTEIQTSTLTGISDVKKQQLESQRNIKNQYEKQFQSILLNMSNVIKDFLKFQIDFKREYFGWNIAQNQAKKNTEKNIPSLKNPVLGKLSSSQSIKSGDSKLKKSFIISQEDQQKQSELQQKLRQILKRKLVPQKQNIIKFCDTESDPFKNMLKLQQKIDMMQSQIILNRNREEKIIDIFNKRRIENIQPKGQNLIHCELIQTDDGSRNKDYQIKQNQKSKGKDRKEKSFGKLERQILQSKSSKKLQMASLDIDVINSSQTINESDRENYGIMALNSSSTPRKLISPKGLKSPSQRNIGNRLHFFGSPKNMIGKNKTTGIQFKKKRQPQDQQTQSTVQQSAILFKQQQNSRSNKLQIQDKVNIENININRIPNKNRDQFLLRRKSNNQPFHTGVSSLIE